MSVAKGLDLLFEGYFHQDWDLDYSSREEVIRAFVQEGPRENASLALAEIDDIIADDVPERKLNKWFRHDIGSKFANKFPHPKWRNALLWYRDQLAGEIAAKDDPAAEEGA
ncbi:contact-dependent growth inhibition system immunity protein [Salinactinospora qingdaonensis]|uniref:CdiI immunity protein domain-containing protein n=1 Tax=Salinactinospora qingdaonensis TaxID=702744 RepID=A0ABP7GFL2_9ACTN